MIHGYDQSDCFTLANGATIDIPSANPLYDWLYIDADGNNGPNRIGEDSIILNWNYSQNTQFLTYGARHNTHTPRPGELLPSWRGSYYGTPKGDVELYHELF